MSGRLDEEREKTLQPRRVKGCYKALTEMGFSVEVLGETTLKFKYKGHTITFFPYSGWHTGKSIKDGRGFNNLIKQLK